MANSRTIKLREIKKIMQIIQSIVTIQYFTCKETL